MCESLIVEVMLDSPAFHKTVDAGLPQPFLDDLGLELRVLPISPGLRRGVRAGLVSLTPAPALIGRRFPGV